MLPRITALLSTLLLVLSASTPGGSQQSGGTTVKYTASLGNSTQCLDEINAAREAAGLSKFAEAITNNKLPDPGSAQLTEDSEWLKLCKHLVPTKEASDQVDSHANSPFKDGTYAFKSLTDEKPDCKSIVGSWKAAFKNFTGLPPSQNQAAGLYNNQDNVSFVALYNPQSTATADCQVATCTKTTSSAPSSLSDTSAATPEKGYALLCKTMPTAFQNAETAPFTQDQWNMITSSLTGSTTTAVPQLIILVIVALGMMTL
ncbi:SAG family member [Eimeria tenella]|uniref:SAG family member n=1 Tax=Eimeria tenella TaxID=5802 RepID=U6KYM1_EIMTE|nr:SAG family member [Eimeria tenella]CDJ40600.1 SAG family member [Eimeria tenella]|eukprot:XP_013231350.1 SAG family member [Eimeria tenella]